VTRRMLTRVGRPTLLALVLSTAMVLAVCSAWWGVKFHSYSGHWACLSKGAVLIGRASPFERSSLSVYRHQREFFFTTSLWSSKGYWALQVPLWPLVPCWLGLAAAKRVRRLKGRCRSCGYDRAGLAEGAACPECGAPG
jgi:hypothetical protein